MFLPIGDTPNPPCRPIMTYVLIGINVAVFLVYTLPLMFAEVDIRNPLLVDYLRSRGITAPLLVSDIKQNLSAYDLAVFQWGFRPGSPSPVTAFTAMFLHGGWMHLLGNMLFLFIFGDNVECRLGRSRFLLAYLGTGVVSTLFFALFAWGSQTPLVGASGAISGVLGLYFIWFPKNKVRTFVFLFPFLITTILIPARFVLGFYLLIENLLPFIFSAPGQGGIAHGAHIGGFIAGAAVAWFLDRRSPLKPSSLRSLNGMPVDLRSLVAGGQFQQALQRYQQYDQNERLRTDPVDLLSLASGLRRQGQAVEACRVLRRLIADHPTSSYLGHALLALGRMLAADPARAATARQYFLTAIDVATDEEVIAAARRDLDALDA